MQAKKDEICMLGRLKKRSDFLRAQQKGRYVATKGLVLEAVPSEERLRYGLTVSRKASPSSVKRNRIKRRLRSLACEILPKHAAPGHDYVLVGRSAALTRSYADLNKDLIFALKKMECFHEERP